ncbi:protein of unknown function [Streptomyces murinus]
MSKGPTVRSGALRRCALPARVRSQEGHKAEQADAPVADRPENRALRISLGGGNERLSLQSAAGLARAARGVDAAGGLAARSVVAGRSGGLAVVGPRERPRTRHPSRRSHHRRPCRRCRARGPGAAQGPVVRAASGGGRLRGGGVAGLDRADAGAGRRARRRSRTAGRGGGRGAAGEGGRRSR